MELEVEKILPEHKKKCTIPAKTVGTFRFFLLLLYKQHG